MSKSFKLFLKTFVISAWCCAVFVGVGFFYLENSFTGADTTTESVPYKQEVTESIGILFKIESEETFINLDFYNGKIVASINPEKSFENQIYGYSNDFSVQSNDQLLVDIIDYLNGLELEIDGEMLRYTGIQTIDLIHSNKIEDYERKIITAICNKISKLGVGTDFFANIIKNSTTNLKLTDCYFWSDEMQSLAKNLHFID